MEKAAQENPLLARELRGGDFLPGGNRGQSGSLSERDKTGMEEDSAQVVNHFHFYEGSKANLPGAQDFSQTIRAEQVQIQQGISPAQILGLLKNPEDIRQLFAGRLSMHLQEESSPGGMHVPLPGEGVGEEESAWQYDLEYDRVGRQIVQDVEVDEEQDLVNVTLEELQTLDARFAEARARCRVEITDEMLETQSERCRFYVKLAVVVEDALQFPGAFSMDDFSPQLVLYGKALEQALRDNLYELFHREPRLSVYSTYSHSENAAASDVFKNKTERETYIGNYAFLIKDQKKYLGELCQRYASDIGSFPAAASWSQWWNQLQLDIHCARRIRNLTDHADETSPDKKNLDHMCALLFGAGDQRGILEKTGIGKKLCVQIFPPALSSDVVEKLVGTFCEMQCTHLKQNGGIRGRTCAGGYPVNISPRKVERYKKTLAGQKFQPVQQVFTVKILEWKIQNGTEFFSAEFADASADRRQE